MNPDNMCCISIVAMKEEAKPAIDKTNELWLRYIAASGQKYKIQNTWLAQYIIHSWWCTNTNGSPAAAATKDVWSPFVIRLHSIWGNTQQLVTGIHWNTKQLVTERSSHLIYLTDYLLSLT